MVGCVRRLALLLAALALPGPARAQPWQQSEAFSTATTDSHPLPSALRCFKLGKALRHAIESYEEDLKVVVLGTGGLSHQLQGERAGLINVDFDLECMDRIASDPEWMTKFSNSEIMRLTGTEGIETIMWLVMRGALQENVKIVHKHYHAPISNTGAGVLVLENTLP